MSYPPPESPSPDPYAAAPGSAGYGQSSYGSHPYGSHGYPPPAGAGYPSSDSAPAAGQAQYSPVPQQYSSGPAAYPGPYATAPAQPWGFTGPQRPLASWGDRVVGSLLDFVFILPGYLPLTIGWAIAGIASAQTTRTSTGRVVNSPNGGLLVIAMLLLVLGGLTVFGLGLYNHVFRQGKTGQTWGKQKRGLRLVHQDTGALIGTGNTFLRYLAHALDGLAYIGYLWPLWDPMRQTFADKIMHTVVVKETV